MSEITPEAIAAAITTPAQPNDWRTRAEAAEARLAELEAAIRRHRDSYINERYWKLNDRALYRALKGTDLDLGDD